MKQIKMALMALLLLPVANTISAQTKTETIKVSGNCGMCAKKIETAAKDAGATTAVWNKKTKELKVTFDAATSSNDAIQKMVASVGYDTEKYTADEKVYRNLHECCQYDNKRTSK